MSNAGKGRPEPHAAAPEDPALALSHRRHATALGLATDGYAALDARGGFLEVNDALCALAGRTREILLELRLDDVLSVEAGTSVADFLARAADAGHARFEGRLESWDAPAVEVSVSLACPRTDGVSEIYLFMHDITERKHREGALEAAIRQNRRARETLLSVLEDQTEIQQSLRESEERFRGMLEHNVSAMFMLEDGRLTYVNPRAGEILGYTPEELVGRDFLELIAKADRSDVAKAVGQLLAGEATKLERNFTALRKDGTFADIGASGTRATLRGKPVILGAAQDIGERTRAQREIERYIARLENSVQATLRAVSNMVELRDPYTSGHERRVGDLAAAIGEELGLAEHVVRGLRLTGYVHDIGKISIPAETLSKPSRLSATEFALVKSHSQAGHDVLKDIDFPWPVAEVILQHHERLDGSGYPRGLKAGEILLEARIISVADVVEAMASHRPYRPGLGIEAALAEIERGAGKVYDAEASRACIRLFRERRFGFQD